jgi:hypothetical protein
VESPISEIVLIFEDLGEHDDRLAQYLPDQSALAIIYEVTTLGAWAGSETGRPRGSNITTTFQIAPLSLNPDPLSARVWRGRL